MGRSMVNLYIRHDFATVRENLPTLPFYDAKAALLSLRLLGCTMTPDKPDTTRQIGHV